MINIFLDLEKMETIDEAKGQIKEVFKLKEQFSGNLDALHDLLTEIGKPTQISIVNTDEAAKDPQIYTARLIKAFLDAAEQNPNLKIELL